MTFNLIHAMALKSVQIDIPAQTISSATTLDLGSITNSSVITVSGNTISLPSGRDYFLTASKRSDTLRSQRNSPNTRRTADS